MKCNVIFFRGLILNIFLLIFIAPANYKYIAFVENDLLKFFSLAKDAATKEYLEYLPIEVLEAGIKAVS